MADLWVDIEGLTAVSSALRSVARGLDDTRGVIEAAQSDLGSGEVYDALDAFESHWDDGREQIKKNMSAIEQALDTAARHYRRTDQNLAAAVQTRHTGGPVEAR